MPSRRGQRLTTPSQHRAVSQAAAVLLMWLLFANARLYSQQQTQEQGGASAGPVVRLLPRPASTIPLIIDSGDLINVQVFDTPELSASHRVSQDGAISLPGTGDIQVLGLTPLQAANLVEKRLRDAQVMLDPHVSVLITEYTTEGITVVGEVKNPGTYSLLGLQSLYSALAAAGGVTQLAGPTVTITHHSDPTHPLILRTNSPRETTDQQLAAVQPGDIVQVSRAPVVYVIGAVTRAGEYSISNDKPLKALNALALAQGLGEYAVPAHASIIRANGDGAITIPVDLNKVIKNQAVDPVLQPLDILVIPRSGFKQFMTVALPGITGAVANAAALALVYR